MKIYECKKCKYKFTQQEYKNATLGLIVGDFEDICYPCQLKREVK
jgi:ribosomal protein L37AE/L43A